MELMLAGWHKDHSAGTKVTFWINDEDLEFFENMTVKKGKTAGQRLAAALVEIGDDEQPVPHETKKPSASKFPIGRCGLAVRWCGDPHFSRWLSARYQETFDLYANNTAGMDEMAKKIILHLCAVKSRNELDADERAAKIFDSLIREPYKTERLQDGLDD